MTWTDTIPEHGGWFYLRSRKTGKWTIGRLSREGLLFADRQNLHREDYILRHYQFGDRVPDPKDNQHG